MMQFECPHCQQSLIAESAQIGELVVCPSCGKSLNVPDATTTPEIDKLTESSGNPDVNSLREGWAESDPSNPNLLLSLVLGTGGLFLWYGLLYPFRAAESVPIADHTTMNWIASLFYGHLAVSMLNTLFFFWAMAIIILKMRMLKHQKAALLLDVLPRDLGGEITGVNVGIFIDHLYSLPEKLRDSLMVNRIRKGLEFFETRQSSGEVREMMSSQSDIDAARITGSFTLLRAFLWAIPLLGFIGTVVGLSHAIGGMNFSNVSDVSKVVEAINNVTSGLGTAFDATLLGLVLAMTLNFPLNSLVKQEDDNLSKIDAFCNEVLLPRLVDMHAETGLLQPTLTDGSLVEIFTSTQREFLTKLDALSQKMGQQAESLDRKSAEFQQVVIHQLVTKTDELRAESLLLTRQAVEESLGKIGEYIAAVESKYDSFTRSLLEAGQQQIARSDKGIQESLGNSEKYIAAVESKFDSFTRSLLEAGQQQIARSDKSIQESLGNSEKYIAGLEAGINSLNAVLKELGEKQVVINVTRKKGWFGRD
jgi:biopolymer transport protein ExbB/TolQ